ncbi:MAG: hypothetical protein U9O87_06535 [Verrucomicrobiota bacterium]|nr:hypothetical protein [Verrucomicrobiota bacterium]
MLSFVNKKIFAVFIVTYTLFLVDSFGKDLVATKELSASEKTVKKAKKNDRNKGPFKGIDKKHIPILAKLQKKEPRLIANWIKVRSLQINLYKVSSTWGTKKRKAIARHRAKLAKEFEKTSKRVDDNLLDLRTEYAKKNQKLKPQNHKINNKIYDENVAETKKEKLRKQLEILTKQQNWFDARIDVLDELRTILKEESEFYSEHLALGLLKQDHNFLQNNFPKILETRRTLQDYDADIERMVKFKTEKKNNWTRKHDAILEKRKSGRELILNNIKKEILNAKKSFERTLHKLERQIKRLNKKIEKKRERGSNVERYEENLEKYNTEKEIIETAFITLDKLIPKAKAKD